MPPECACRHRSRRAEGSLLDGWCGTGLWEGYNRSAQAPISFKTCANVGLSL